MASANWHKCFGPLDAVAGGSPSAPYGLRVRRRGAGPCLCAVRWAVTVVADRHRRAAAPVTGTPGRARSASWSEHPCGCAFGQAAVSPYRASGRPGQVERKVEPGAAPGGHGHVSPINRPLANSLAAGGAAVGCVASYRHSTRTPWARAPGGFGLGCRHWQARITKRSRLMTIRVMAQVLHARNVTV